MSTTSPKTFGDVRTAFENRSVLAASRRELEELLAASVCATSEDAAVREQTHDMSEALVQLIANRRSEDLRRPSKTAVLALLLIATALIWCGAQAYYARAAFSVAQPPVTNQSEEEASAQASYVSDNDSGTSLTIAELASRSPSLRNGSVQAWWVGEQARQVQRLEAEAKRQMLSGDYDGATRTSLRANQIRSGIPALAGFERTPAR
ncbi:MAG: hypothetical protein ACJ8HQ_00415 [Chthoniobacterales bacterium]